MAFGFIKKVFSFGKKEVVEEKIDEQAPLPPINWDSLEALRSDAPAVAEATPSPVENRAEPPAEAQPVEPPVQPKPISEPVHPTEPALAQRPEPQPKPAPEEPAPLPTPAEPAPSPVPEVPAPVPSPAEPSRPPVEIPVPPAEPAPEPQPSVPQEVPEEPAPARETPPAAIPTPPVEPQPTPTHAPLDVPSRAEDRSQEDLPAAEALPPLRQLPPVEPHPVRSEIAPEPTPLPSLETPPPPLEESAEARLQVSDEETAPPPPADISSPTTRERQVGSADAPLAPSLWGEEEEQASEERKPSTASQPIPGKVTVAKAVEKKAEPEKTPEPVPRTSWFQRLREGLSRSSKELSSNIASVFTKRKLDDDTLQDLEDVLIRADLGMETAIRVTDALASGRYGKDVSEAEVRAIMAEEVEKVLAPVALPLELDLSHKPHVILVVGVNGTGKTTTIGKLAAKLVSGGLSVTLAAGDTFRAAAIEQLKIWGERTGSPVIASKLGADAAGLAFDAFQQAKEAGSDVLIVDTAGRLQNKAELMAELEKIVRVLGKLDPEAPHTVLQTVDATTGQNALNQVEIFRNVAGVNGLVMTKLDGTARGGILVAIAAKHKLPVYFIGVGEQVDDLEPFSANDFAKAIAGVS